MAVQRDPAEVIQTAISIALERGEVEAVPDLLRMMIAVDPRRAALIYDTLKVGLAISRDGRGVS